MLHLCLLHKERLAEIDSSLVGTGSFTSPNVEDDADDEEYDETAIALAIARRRGGLCLLDFPSCLFPLREFPRFVFFSPLFSFRSKSRMFLVVFVAGNASDEDDEW